MAGSKRKKNPVPPSSVLRIEEGMRLFEAFTGHKGELFAVPKPKTPEAVIVVGYCDGIMYETVRDGKTEKYLHRFKKKSRPLLTASTDGKSLYLLGGAYDFTDRGIVDKES